jgi:hypothetical protein
MEQEVIEMADKYRESKLYHANGKDPTLKDALIDTGLMVDLYRTAEEYKGCSFVGKVTNLPTEYNGEVIDENGNATNMQVILDRAVLIGNETCGFVLNSEVKSQPQADAPLQIYREEFSITNYFIVKRQVDKTRELKRKGKKYRYRLKASDTIPDILNSLVYTGEKVWPKSCPLNMRRFIRSPDGRIFSMTSSFAFIDLPRLSEEAQERGGDVIKAIVAVLQARRDRKKLKEAIGKHRETFSCMHIGLALALCAEINDKRLKKYIVKAVIDDGGEEEKADMCKALDDWEAEINRKNQKEIAKKDKALKQAKEEAKQKEKALKEEAKQKEKALKEEAKLAKEEARQAKEEAKLAKEEAKQKENALKEEAMRRERDLLIETLLECNVPVKKIYEKFCSKFNVARSTASRYFRDYKKRNPGAFTAQFTA